MTRDRKILIAAAFLSIALKLVAVASTGSYIPVKCMNHFIVNNWGICTQEGSLMHCPTADVQFSVACVSTKSGRNTGDLSVYYPTAALVNKQGAPPHP